MRSLYVGSIRMALFTALIGMGLMGATISLAADGHTTTKFEGAKANKGTATHSRQGNNDTLTWSDDYKIPDTPAPHWQVVDSKGNVYLLNQQRIKGDKQNKSIVLPPYVQDVVKVQVWCSFAEALLGEASFSSPIQTASGEVAIMQANAMKSGR
ncbi:MAG: hypothetical protein ACREJU_14715 [Nitrospiraceae bacterium]